MDTAQSAQSENLNPSTVMQKLRKRFIEPSPGIHEQDQRRQAALLSGFLIGLILLAVVAELVSIAFIEWETYTGYRQTIMVVILLTIIYLLSRTRHVSAAALLAVVASSVAVYFTGWAQPAGVLGGLFDFLILPLWLGGLYLRSRWLIVLIFANLIALLAFPSVAPEVTLNAILVGPFSFILITSILLLIVTNHRNNLEQDRRAELIEKEQLSQRQAARAGTLLRVAERLNAQLDLDTLLTALSEEVNRAFGAPVSLVTLFDSKQNEFHPAAGSGTPPELLRHIPPLPREIYDRTVKQLGSSFAILDLQATPSQAYLDPFKQLNLRSLAFATMKYEEELIGGLAAITIETTRNFTRDELLLLQGIADQAALALVNTRLYKDARRRLEHLQALRAIDIVIATNHDLRDALEVVLAKVTERLAVDAAVILLLDDGKQQLEFAASRGFHTPTLRFTRLRMGEGIAGRAAQQQEIIAIPDLRADPQTLVYAPSFAREGFASYYAAPLLSQGKVNGVLEIFHRSTLDPDDEWLGFLETLAGQAAIAIESTTLFNDLQRINDELTEAYDSTIEGWSHALDLRDRETEGHTLRVTELTVGLARAFDFSAKELMYIRWGALLHDIGKMGIPDSILLNKGPLTREEWAVMRQHPAYAHEMLRSIQYLRPALDIPYCHHEKWDGTGYPRELKGNEIPLTARIFAVADVWDALTSNRPYRKAWSREKALEYIRDQSGRHFDPRVVDTFTHFIEGGREPHDR